MEKGGFSDPESVLVPVESLVMSSAQSLESVDDSERRGGLCAWTTVVSAFLIQLSTVGYTTAFGVFQDFYVREFLTTSSSSQISWVGSTQSFLILTMGLLTGPFFDNGYCYHLVISGAIVLVFSLFMLSLAQPEQFYQIFLSQGLGFGIGSGLLFAPSLAILAQHFPAPHARARAMCIAVAGTSIGGLVHPILLNQLLHRQNTTGVKETRETFARAARASAGLTAGLLIIAIMLMRTKYPPKEVTRKKTSLEKGPIKLKNTMKKFLSDWPYLCFIIGMTLYEMVFFFPSFYLQLDAIKHRLDPTFSFYSLSILNGMAFFGRLAPGFCTRVFGVANMFVVASVLATVLIFWMLAVKTIAEVATFAALYGFFSGALMALLSPMIALLAEDTTELGARMGFCFMITGFGSLTGTPIAGALLTSNFIWWRPIVFSGVVCAVGLILFVVCRIMLGKRKGSNWIV